MGIFRYLSHPQVVIDPNLEVRSWSLSDLGRQRAETCGHAIALEDTTRLFSSSEVKAVETAGIIGEALTLVPKVLSATHENDRTSTGFLPSAEFEATADQFFAHPSRNIRGWESADDAQARIVNQVFGTIMTRDGQGDILCVGHGAVGTLLYCHLMDLDISRVHDQPEGGGNLFAFDMDSDEVLHGWMPIEVFCGLTGTLG